MLDKVFDKYSFTPLNSFLNKLKQEVVNYKFEEKRRWINFYIKLKNDLDLKIIILSDEEKDWITFYFIKDPIKIEQVEFIMLKDNENDVNRVIRHDYFTLDGQIATTFNSAYSYIDNMYQSGWEFSREVNYKDIENYAGKDNLANLACHIDNSTIEIIYKQDKNIVDEPDINVVAMYKEKSDVKVLSKKNKKI